MPELLLVLAVLLPVLHPGAVARRDRLGRAGWVLPARVPGIAARGAGPGPVLRPRPSAIAVARDGAARRRLTPGAVEVPVRRRPSSWPVCSPALAGTATSIGGPPVALLYQHRPPQQIRSTLAVLFTVGAAMSLRHLDRRSSRRPRAAAALVLTPCLVLGAWVGCPAAGRAAGPARAVRRAGGLCGLGAGAARAQPGWLTPAPTRAWHVWPHDDARAALVRRRGARGGSWCSPATRSPRPSR